MFELLKKPSAKTKTYMIAEIGINHDGDLDKAKKLIESATFCGASAVKLQTYITEERVDRASPIFDLLKKCELSFDDQEKLFDFGRNLGVDVFSTPFDKESVQFLGSVDCPIIKIASFDSTNNELIRQIKLLKRNVIMSTGMTSHQELAATNKLFQEEIDQKKFALMHCISSYPTDPKMANLRAITAIRGLFQGPVGYSDHTLGWKIPFYSIFAGAEIIEKHFTLNRDDDGPDHQMSADPVMFSKIVHQVQIAEEIMGEQSISISPSELNFLQFKRTKS